ncbi:MAG TPA: sialidase family protein [Ktedonobacterales bacterium]
MTSDFESGAAHNDGAHTLPTDTQLVYHALERDGAAWLVGATPEIERLNGRLQAQVNKMSDAFESETTPDHSDTLATVATVAAPHETPGGAYVAHQTPRRSGRARGWAASLATAAVIIAFLTVYALSATHRPSGSSKQVGVSGVSGASSATGVPHTITPHDFVSLSKLDYSTDYGSNDIPAIAPSDPQVVYESMAYSMQQHQAAHMRATSDGGATWRSLGFPVAADHIGYIALGVSPTNARTVFMQLDDTSTADCPANRLMPSEGSFSFCMLQYTSLDGGANWQTTMLPLADGTKPGVLSVGMSSFVGMGGSIHAQGSRLFANYACAKFSDNCSRLVMSADGGLTWTFTDAPLAATGMMCDYTASVSGSTLFAVVGMPACDSRSQSPEMLWRSDDAGAHWSKVSKLAAPNDRGLLLTQNAATGASVLYMALPRTSQMQTDKMGTPFPLFSQAPSDVLASVDGGATWQHAPTAGVPTDQAVYLGLGLLGTLRDGSVVVDVITSDRNGSTAADNMDGSSLYIWRAGDASWRKIGSLTRAIDGLVITPSPRGAGNSIYAVLINRQNTGTFAFVEAEVAQ